MVNTGMRQGLPAVFKYFMRADPSSLDLNEFLPSIDVESCFEFYASALLILQSTYLLECTETEYGGELLVYLIRLVCIKPKFITSMHHNFLQPWKGDLKKSQLYFLRGSDLMENVTESSDDLHSQLVSHIAKCLIRKAMSFKDSKTKAISNINLLGDSS